VKYLILRGIAAKERLWGSFLAVDSATAWRRGHFGGISRQEACNSGTAFQGKTQKISKNKAQKQPTFTQTKQLQQHWAHQTAKPHLPHFEGKMRRKMRLSL